jgi:hypothetical protein
MLIHHICALIAQNTETILQQFTREPSVLHTMACRRVVDMRLIPLLLLLLVAPLATVTRKYKHLGPLIFTLATLNCPWFDL